MTTPHLSGDCGCYCSADEEGNFTTHFCEAHGTLTPGDSITITTTETIADTTTRIPIEVCPNCGYEEHPAVITGDSGPERVPDPTVRSVMTFPTAAGPVAAETLSCGCRRQTLNGDITSWQRCPEHGSPAFPENGGALFRALTEAALRTGELTEDDVRRYVHHQRALVRHDNAVSIHELMADEEGPFQKVANEIFVRDGQPEEHFVLDAEEELDQLPDLDAIEQIENPVERANARTTAINYLWDEAHGWDEERKQKAKGILLGWHRPAHRP